MSLSRFTSTAIALGLSLLPVTSFAKDVTIGVYGIVDQVTFEPDQGASQSIRISGVFVVPVPISSGDYRPPQRGDLRFQIRPGNRLSVTELNNRLVTYQYDNDYRLTQEQVQSDPAGNNGAVNYGPNGYDNVGNRLLMSSTLSGVPGGTFSYDANDRLSIDSIDADGNTTSSGSILNQYDFENRMTLHGGVQLQYDGDGNRVKEIAGGVTTTFLVDDHNPTGLPQLLDEIVSGSVTRTYAYGLNRISENQQIGGNWTPSFYGYDGHGNARFLMNAAGTITDSYDFDAFGMPIRTAGATPNVFLYSGERFDSSVGLYDLRARYYKQATGRFWSRDPVEGRKCCGLSWNPYIYVKNNAINSLDPSGRDSIIEYEIGIYTPIRTGVTAEALGFGSCIAGLYVLAADVLHGEVNSFDLILGGAIATGVGCGVGFTPYFGE